MKAVAFTGPRRLELREVPDPRPGEGEVLVQVAYCGVCGSDLHEYASQQPSLRLAGVFQPVMGHEFSGTVLETGPGVSGLSPGDPVVVNPGAYCGECSYCRAGATNLCGEQMGTGYNRQGAYAERVVVKQRQALPLPGPEWLERAALTEPLAVAMRAVNRGGLRPGETVFIAGGGPIGLLATIAARRKEPATIIVSEPAAARRELALRLGAGHAIDPAAGSVFLQVQELTGGLGADLAIEAVGVAQTMGDCLAATRKGGRIVVAGAFEEPYPLNLLTLLIQEHSVIGTFGYAEEFAEARDLITSGAVDVRPLISGHVGLGELPDAFARLTEDRGGFLKLLVRP